LTAAKTHTLTHTPARFSGISPGQANELLQLQWDQMPFLLPNLQHLDMM